MQIPSQKHRRTLRLPEFDYNQPGAYFITIVTKDRTHLFGEIEHGSIHLNRFGEIAWSTWMDLPRHYRHVQLDAFVTMPNHVHGIILLEEGVQTGITINPGQAPHGLPEIVRSFKTFSARRINTLRHMSGSPVWQRGYYEHIIRNQDDLEQIRQYIEGNPLMWEQDQEYK